MKSVARCGIYEKRPKVCRDYPGVGNYLPPECTYTFPEGDGVRHGDCTCEEGACCRSPRENGEPGGTPLPEAAGGEPCKHLVWEEQETEKTASAEEITSTIKEDVSNLLRVLGQDD